jgi:hypothetical protein
MNPAIQPPATLDQHADGARVDRTAHPRGDLGNIVGRQTQVAPADFLEP